MQNQTALRDHQKADFSHYWDKISWTEMTFECCLRTEIDALRPPLLIYVSKTRIGISEYFTIL